MREIFTKEDLQKIISSDEYRRVKGKQFKKHAFFWAPLISMFTGARLSEICQLKVSDICEEEGIWYFAFCSDGMEVAKTKAAVRNVPVHEMLIKIGLSNYLKQQKRRNETLLFSDLTKHSKNGYDAQVKAVLKYLESCKWNSLRNQVMFLLSLHGMRAKEITELQIGMMTTAEGAISDVIALQDKASKERSGRTIPMNKLLKELLSQYVGARAAAPDGYVIVTERSEKFSANAIAVYFKPLYKKLGFSGCSSHSGRRTLITNCARKISLAGGSMRDVMNLAGHKNLQTTQGYIEQNGEAQSNLVNLLYPSIKG